MIYSQWVPDTGGYRYLEGVERRGLGDDLDVPRLPMGTEIGVPSVECGRKPRGSTRMVGEGEHAKGAVLPVDARGLSGAVGAAVLPWVSIVLAGLVGLWLGRNWK